MKAMFGLGILVGGFVLAMWLRTKGRLGRVGSCWVGR
jgi:hypothetical protein